MATAAKEEKQMARDNDAGLDQPFNLIVRVNGSTPYLMHNERMADPLDAHARALAELSRKTRKTIAEHEQMARVEFEGTIYHDPDVPGPVPEGALGPYLPARQLWRMLIAGGTAQKIGENIRRGVQIVEQRVPLNYDGPRDIDGLWAEGYWDRSTIVVSQKRVPRTRPCFTSWAATVRYWVVRTEVDFDKLERAGERGGALYGLGDARKLGFGRCQVTMETVGP